MSEPDEKRAPLDELPVRSFRELDRILQRFGTPFAAAYHDQINAAEYLKLEQLNEH